MAEGPDRLPPQRSGATGAGVSRRLQPLSLFGRVRALASSRVPGDLNLWLALALTVPALVPLLAPGYFFDAHDAHHSVFFLVEFDQAVRDGALWPVWGPDLAIGFGYPLWLVYAPLPYMVAEAFHLLGMGFTAAVKATWILGFLLGTSGMYRLARRWWGSGAGLVASLAFTYAPYHLAQIYVRGAFAEFMALAWLPWAFLGLAFLWERPGPRRASLAGLALGIQILLHTVSVLVTAPLLAGWILLQVVQSWREAGRGRGFRWPALLWTALALALSGLLASVFVIPMLAERRFIAEAQWVHATYEYSQHFVYPAQFFDPTWGYGYSVAGAQDGMSFQLGVVIVVLAVLGALAALLPRAGGLTRRAEALLLAAAGILAALLMTPVSAPLWDRLPLVSLVQFPWRLLTVMAFVAALLAGAAAAWLDQRAGQTRLPSPYGALLAALLVLASFSYVQPQIYPVRPQDEQSLAVIEFELRFPDMRGMTSWSERVPRDEDSPLIAQYLAGEPLRRAAVVAGRGVITDQSATALSASVHVRAEDQVRLRFYTYYFPGWRATVNGQPAAIAADPPNGLIGLTLPPGEHDVVLRFGATPVRRLGGALSGVGLLLTILLWVDLRVSVHRSVGV